MAYRDDLTALSARHDALADEVQQKTRELEASRRLLEQARAQAKLPVLDNLRVASPCTADWNQMTGDDRARHCGDCQKSVYNLSGMTRDEAEALLIEKNGDLCVRYFQRHDGTILLADCTIGVKRRQRRRLIAAGAATLLAGGAAATAFHHAQSYQTLGAVGFVEPRPPIDPAPETVPAAITETESPRDQPQTTVVPVPPKDPGSVHVKMGKFVRTP
jgi:hypothetical protein